MMPRSSVFQGQPWSSQPLSWSLLAKCVLWKQMWPEAMLFWITVILASPAETQTLVSLQADSTYYSIPISLPTSDKKLRGSQRAPLQGSAASVSPSWGQWCASPQMLLFWQACTGRWHSHATLRGSLYGLKTFLVQSSASKGQVLLHRDDSFSHGQLFKEKNSNLAPRQAVWLGWVVRKTSRSGTQFTHARCQCFFSKRT